ncbi:MAG TPA: hypothetical protein VI894_02600, partial [Candidatus Nanoarchaeia archaeon]|nr:hypothetical protein [Candidatus Nanoarchaeia archaeon]
RFSIILLPYISLLSAFGTVFLWKKIRNLKMIASLFLLIIVALSALTLSRDVGYYNWVLKNEPDKATELYRMNYPKEGYLLTTDPIIASYSDAKIEPFYFSVDEGYEIFLEKRMNASAIVYNENFYPCFDEKCKQKKNEMLEFMEKNYSLAFKKKYDDVYYVFVRK